jgi:YMGG-like Gly-zipper
MLSRRAEPSDLFDENGRPRTFSTGCYGRANKYVAGPSTVPNMNKLLILGCGLAVVLPAQAQLFSPESVTGAGFGALTGGLIGHGSGHHGWEGAAIGAGAGFLIGSLIHEDRRDRYYYGPGYGYQGPAGYYYAPSYTPSYSYAPAPAQAPAVTEVSQPVSQSPAPASAAPARVSNMAGANSLFGR